DGWTVPVGSEIAKVAKLGKLPVRVQLGAVHAGAPPLSLGRSGRFRWFCRQSFRSSSRERFSSTAHVSQMRGDLGQTGEAKMNTRRKYRGPLVLPLTAVSAALIATGWWAQLPSAYAAPGELRGQVLGGGAPIANSTVTAFAASAGDPQQLGQARTGADGRF